MVHSGAFTSDNPLIILVFDRILFISTPTIIGGLHPIILIPRRLDQAITTLTVILPRGVIFTLELGGFGEGIGELLELGVEIWGGTRGEQGRGDGEGEREESEEGYDAHIWAD